MKSPWISHLLLILTTLGSACSQDPIGVHAPASQDRPSVPIVRDRVLPSLEATYPDQFFTKADTLSYADFTIAKRTRYARVEGHETELSYARLTKAGRTVRTFDGLQHPSGNQTDFGLCSVLGMNTHQLVVEQTGPRNWLHWIVDLDAGGRVIFDGERWHVDRELAIVDLDGDGVSEILQTVTSFWHLFSSGAAGTMGSPSVVFAYDSAERYYIPASSRFADYREKLGLGSRDSTSTDAVLAETLHLLYIGREQDAWAHFEREYDSPEKRRIEREVRRILKTETVYAFLRDNAI